VSRPRTEDPNRVATALRLPPDLSERLASEADRRDISRNRLVIRVLEWALPEWEAEDA
jgi:predicted HicB family RNase H-like nuclease